MSNKGTITYFLLNHIFRYPAPLNLSYFWNMGFISLVFMFIQLITGILLSFHFCSDSSLAFSSVEHIMRDVNYGWLLRYMHSNGASFFFISVYLHIARNLYYKLYSFNNINVWTTGMSIFLLMMAEAFVGYVLPWGQMSFWGATVITNLFSIVPYIGDNLVQWIWGGFSVANPTLVRFFSLHYLLPFILLVFIFLHLFYLHENGSSNPSIISVEVNRFYVPLYPYFVIKDFLGLFVFIFFYLYMVFFNPDFLGHSDNYIEANPLSTPEHIVPEWYFLPFYAILRSIDNKFVGVIAMFVSIVVFFLFPILHGIIFRFYSDFHKFENCYILNKYIHPFLIYLFFSVFILLGWVGMNPVEYPFVNLGSLLIFLYFFLIFLILFIPVIFFKFHYRFTPYFNNLANNCLNLDLLHYFYLFI